jgi:hypothetical protein
MIIRFDFDWDGHQQLALQPPKCDQPVPVGVGLACAQQIAGFINGVELTFDPVTPPPRAEEPKPAEKVNTLSRPADNG